MNQFLFDMFVLILTLLVLLNACLLQSNTTTRSNNTTEIEDRERSLRHFLLKDKVHGPWATIILR